jgi:hypothetical protein
MILWRIYENITTVSQLSTFLLFLLSFCTNLTSARPNAQIPPAIQKRQQIPSIQGHQTSPIYSRNNTATAISIRDNLYGERNAGYFVTSIGLAVIGGDVVYGSLSDLLTHQINGAPANATQARAFSVFSGWPSARILYKYDTNCTERDLSHIVDAAITRWRAQASHLNFQHVRPNSGIPTDVVVTIRAAWCDGCYANIGFASDRPQYMNLEQPGCGTDVAVHEISHVLGIAKLYVSPKAMANLMDEL